VEDKHWRKGVWDIKIEKTRFGRSYVL